MKVGCDSGVQLAVAKASFDANAQKRQIEKKIRAADERTQLFLANAAWKDIEAYKQSMLDVAAKPLAKTPIAQLCLNFDVV
jgi:hypothetical protein